MIELSKKEAARFMLLQQGLAGPHRFIGKSGVLEFICQAGSVQFDPIDVCGRSADLALLSRVKDYSPSMLQELLYIDRALIDHYDKMMSIFPVESWNLLAADMEHALPEGEQGELLAEAAKKVLAEMASGGPKKPTDFELNQKVEWYGWYGAPVKLAKAAFEHLYYRGEVLVHNKTRNIKIYDLAERILPEAVREKPRRKIDDSWYADMVKRRIRAVGLLWNKASDAWLGIRRNSLSVVQTTIERLLEAKSIFPIKVEGIKHTLFAATEDQRWLENVNDDFWRKKRRLELIAPLDSFMWDRRLIEALFDFSYRWEIYTPEAKRIYGYYTLPVLFGDRLVGRIEPYRDKDTLRARGLWLEQGVRLTRTMETSILKALGRLATMNGMVRVDTNLRLR